MSDIVPVQPGSLAGVLSGGVPALPALPFAQEIYLTHFEVAGLMYVPQVEALLESLQKGQRLLLCREPENQYDEYAILVQDADRHKLGYMPRRMNHIPARLMDAGKLLYVKVSTVHWDYAELSVDLFMQG